MIGADPCSTWPRWQLGSVEWLGYPLAVYAVHPDDESNWSEVEYYHRDIGGALPSMPEHFREDPARYRDPLTWCAAPAPLGAMT